MRRRHYSSGFSPKIETFTICVLLFIAGFFTFGIAWVALLVVVVRSTRLSSALLKPEPKPKRQAQEWPQLSRIRRAEEARRKQQEADEALKYAGTPDKPYVQKLTAEEQALKDQIDAARQKEAAEILEAKDFVEAARLRELPPWVQELKNDPTVIWLDDNRYRLEDDPEYLTRSIKPIDVPKQFRAESSARSPETKYGPRGGRYTEDRTKDGRPYRRYF